MLVAEHLPHYNKEKDKPVVKQGREAKGSYRKIAGLPHMFFLWYN